MNNLIPEERESVDQAVKNILRKSVIPWKRRGEMKVKCICRKGAVNPDCPIHPLGGDKKVRV